MSALARIGRSRLLGVVLILALLATWQLATSGGGTATVPRLSTVLSRWRELIDDGTLWSRLMETLSVMARGYLLGGAAGILVGSLMGYSRTAWALLEPLVELLRPIPIAAAVPLLILFFGIDDGLKVAAITAATFFPVLINTFSGVRAVPSTLRDTARTFRLGTPAVVVEVVLRHATPAILVGLRLALSISLIVAVFTEMISGSSGMGYFILNAQQTLTIVDIYVGVLTLAVVGYLLNVVFLLVEATVIPWHDSSARRRTRV